MEVEISEYEALVKNALHLNTNVPFDELEDDISTAAASIASNSLSLSTNNSYRIGKEEIIVPVEGGINSMAIRVIPSLKRRNKLIENVMMDYNEIEKGMVFGGRKPAAVVKEDEIICDDEDEGSDSVHNDMVSNAHHHDGSLSYSSPANRLPHLPISTPSFSPPSGNDVAYDGGHDRCKVQNGYYRIYFDHENVDDCIHEEAFELQFVGKNYYAKSTEEKKEQKILEEDKYKTNEVDKGQGVETECSCIIC